MLLHCWLRRSLCFCVYIPHIPQGTERINILIILIILGCSSTYSFHASAVTSTTAVRPESYYEPYCLSSWLPRISSLIPRVLEHFPINTLFFALQLRATSTRCLTTPRSTESGRETAMFSCPARTELASICQPANAWNISDPQVCFPFTYENDFRWWIQPYSTFQLTWCLLMFNF